MIAPNQLYGQQHAQDTPEYSRAYAELGLGVVPVHGIVAGVCTCGKDCGRNAGKHPIAQLVRRGVKDASTCPETVSEWYREWPAANVAIACGSVSEIVVVDSDGEAGVAELERRGYPVTWTARSGSGWLHVYLGHPGHRVGNRKIPGIGDLRADGGYVVAPPSRHRSGGRYEWLPDLSPWDVGLASAPEWVPLEVPQETPRVRPPASVDPPPEISRLSRRMQDLIRYGNRGEYESRSEADFAVCLAMFGAGYAEAEVWAVMIDPTLYLEGPVDPNNVLQQLVPEKSALSETLRNSVASDLDIDDAECEEYLTVVTVRPEQPPRNHVENRNIEMMGEYAPSLSRLELQGVHQRVMNELQAAMARERVISLMPEYIENPDALQQDARSRVEAKRLTRSVLAEMMQAVVSGTYLLRLEEADKGVTTILEQKLLAGGADESIVTSAKMLRANATTRESELLSATLYDTGKIEDVQARLQVFANGIVSRYGGETAPAPQAWSDLLLNLPAQTDVLDQHRVYYRDPMLLLGAICGLSDECLVRWGGSIA